MSPEGRLCRSLRTKDGNAGTGNPHDRSARNDGGPSARDGMTTVIARRRRRRSNLLSPMTLLRGKPRPSYGSQPFYLSFLHEHIDSLRAEHKPPADLAFGCNDGRPDCAQDQLILRLIELDPLGEFSKPYRDPGFPPRCYDRGVIPGLGVQIAADHQQLAFQDQPRIAPTSR